MQVIFQDRTSCIRLLRPHKIAEMRCWEVPTCLLNSPDLTPSDFYLSGSLKESLDGIKVANSDAVQPASDHLSWKVLTKISIDIKC